MIVALVLLACGSSAPALAADDPAGGAGQQPSPPASTRRTRVTIYPLLVQAPIFGATINLPARGGDNEQDGSTDVSFNSAWGYGLRVVADRWLAEFNGMWADVSAERNTPFIEVDTNTRLVNGRGGVRVASGLYATGGFRRISSELSFTLAGTSRTFTASTEPVLWDPVIGAGWRSERGPLRFDATFEGGGFGVGTDVEYWGEANVDWELFRHFVLRAGYTVFYYKMTIADVNVSSEQRTVVSKQTLHGPVLGIGLTF